MTKKHSTKRALIASLLTLCLSFTMLLGTTYAWFTDSVSSTGNVIQTGTLNVEMYWAEGAKNPADESAWGKVNGNPLFNNTLWEPGYTEAKHIKIANEGTLALKYEVRIVALGEVEDLSDVIDVYLFNTAQAIDRDTAVTDGTHLGTLTEVLNPTSDGYITKVINSHLSAKTSHTYTLVLKMQETAGNDYQDKEIGTAFDIQLLATQYTEEKDSFGNDYDADATYPIVPSFPVASTAELLDRLSEAEPGDTIFLAAGKFDLPSTLSIPSGVSLRGVQADVPAIEWVNDSTAAKTVISYTGSGNALEILQTSEEPDEAVANITINGIMIDGNNTADKALYVKKSDGEALEGIKVLNCAVVNTKNDGLDVKNTAGAVIENNYIANVVDSAIVLESYNGYHYLTWAESTAYVCNNVIENVKGTSNGAINIANGMGDVVVSGNVIKNVVAAGSNGYSSSDKASAITVSDVYEGGEIVIEDNVIENVDQGIAVYKYTYSTVYGKDWWEGPTTDNDGIVIRNNTITEFKYFGIKTSKLAEKSAPAETVVEITDNVINSTVTANALSVETANDDWTVVASGNTLNGSEEGVNGTWNQ